MATDKNKIIEMIAKMSALTADSGAFQGEISNASSKIQELMDKYSISWNEVHAHTYDKQSKEYEEAFGDQSSDYMHKQVKKWHWDLARLIARVTHTRQFLSGSRFAFFGTVENAEIASALYTLWVSNISKMSEDALKVHKREMLKEFGDHKNFWSSLPYDLQPKNFKPGWIDGCLAGMLKNVAEQEQQRPKEAAASIVLYKKSVDIEYEKISKRFKTARVSRSSGFSNAGYAAGSKVGSSINIASKPVSAGRKQLTG